MSTWLALLDNRIVGEIQFYFGREATVQKSRLSKGESVRSTRVFLHLRQSFSSFPRGLDLLKQVEKEYLTSSTWTHLKTSRGLLAMSFGVTNFKIFSLRELASIREHTES